MDPDRPITQHPIVEKERLNYELCADLHNALWHISWAGSTERTEPYPPPTWWEYFTPPDAVASRLSPELTEFFKRAYYREDVGVVFYTIQCLSYGKELLDNSWFRDKDTDRFLMLHYATPIKCGDAMGLVYDQWNAKAAFVPFFEDVTHICDSHYGWMPLENIYSAYLDMIKEGKVQVVPKNPREFYERGYNEEYGPFLWINYTSTDVEKSIRAFQRLLDAITSRQGQDDHDQDGSGELVALPWRDPTTLDAMNIYPGMFARDFCEQSAAMISPIKFRYIAPGIRIPTTEQFMSSILYCEGTMPHHRPPILLFTADDPVTPISEEPSRVAHIFSRCTSYPDIPTGLYLNNSVRMNDTFENECRLRLPFAIGSADWARLSDSGSLASDWMDIDDTPYLSDVNDTLYQPGINGYFWHRDVQFHKVLDNWAERVECGDWEVGPEGVLGGIDKFREADTKEHWRKYWIPPSW